MVKLVITAVRKDVFSSDNVIHMHIDDDRQVTYSYFKWSMLSAQLNKDTCMATGKSFWASGGKKTSTAFFGNGWLPVAGVPTSMMCNCVKERKLMRNSHIVVF